MWQSTTPAAADGVGEEATQEGSAVRAASLGEEVGDKVGGAAGGGGAAASTASVGKSLDSAVAGAFSATAVGEPSSEDPLHAAEPAASPRTRTPASTENCQASRPQDLGTELPRASAGNRIPAPRPAFDTCPGRGPACSRRGHRLPGEAGTSNGDPPSGADRTVVRIMTGAPDPDEAGAVLDGERPVEAHRRTRSALAPTRHQEVGASAARAGRRGRSPQLVQRGEPTSVGIGHRGRVGAVTPSVDVGEGKEWDPGGGLVGASGAGQFARQAGDWRYTRQTPCAGQLRNGEPRTRPSPSDYKGGGMGHRDGESCPRTDWEDAEKSDAGRKAL